MLPGCAAPPCAMTIRTLIVDDSPLTAELIATYLESVPEVELVASAGNAEDALAYASTSPLDLVITDLRLPLLNGMELAERLRRKHPALRVILLSVEKTPQLIQSATRRGVDIFVDKGQLHEELIASIHKLFPPSAGSK
jgi:two-component system, NarL family, nitrate/nitrite response regulator NarL